MTLRSRLAKLTEHGGFVRSVLTLVSGTAIGHAVTAAALPVLTRIYTPAEFGLYGILTSIFFTFAVIACLRFDVAIALTSDEEEAEQLFLLSVLSSILVSAAVAGLVVLVPWSSVATSDVRPVLPYLGILPPALLLAGVFAAMQSWAVRHKEFGSIARARVGQSVAAAGLQIGLGLAGWHVMGLAMGMLANSAGGIVLLARRTGNAIRRLWPPFDITRLKQTGSKYGIYPTYSSVEALANSAAIQLPLVVVAAFAGSDELGQLVLAMTVVQAPMALFGTAVTQVFLSQGRTRLAEGTLAAFTGETVRSLAKLGAPVLLAIGVVSPYLFPLLFGEDWARAGMLSAWLVPWLIFQFVASPIIFVFHLLGRQRLIMWLQMFSLAIRCGFPAIAGWGLGGWESEAYAMSGLLVYAILLVGALLLVAGSDRDKMSHEQG